MTLLLISIIFSCRQSLLFTSAPSNNEANNLSSLIFSGNSSSGVMLSDDDAAQANNSAMVATQSTNHLIMTSDLSDNHGNNQLVMDCSSGGFNSLQSLNNLGGLSNLGGLCGQLMILDDRGILVDSNDHDDSGDGIINNNNESSFRTFTLRGSEFVEQPRDGHESVSCSNGRSGTIVLTEQDGQIVQVSRQPHL